MNLSELQQLFFGTTKMPLVLTPGEKTQSLLREMNAHVLHILVEQRVFFVTQRSTFIHTLAENLKEHWIPRGLSAQDMESIPSDWFTGIIQCIINGTGLGGYEERLYAHFSRLAQPPESTASPEHAELSQEERSSRAVDMPAVSEPERRNRQITGRRAYSRRRVS